MAIYCGVCATSIGSAPENEGSFSVNDFGGWDTSYANGVPSSFNKSVIRDTCEACASRLRSAITKEAKEIVRENQYRVDSLRTSVRVQRAREEKLRKEKQEFESVWREKLAQERREKQVMEDKKKGKVKR